MAPPFKHVAADSPYLELENPFTLTEGLKLVLLFPLVVFRLLVLVILLLLLAVVSFFASIGADLRKPFPTWRRAIVHTLRPIARLVVVFLGVSVNLEGWKNYQQALKNDLKLVVFNHPGWVDPVIMLYLFAPSGVSREANNRIPIIGTIIRSFQNINVAAPARIPASEVTDNPAVPLEPRSATALIRERDDLSPPAPMLNQHHTCRLYQDGWPVVAIAPEGMTHNGKQVLKFKSGAFVFGKPVLPVCITYKNKPLSPAWTIQSEPWHMLRMLSQPWTTAYVQILPMYDPSQEEQLDARLYADNVRATMAQAMGVPLCMMGIQEYKDVLQAGVSVNWRGELVVPEGSIDAEGSIVAVAVDGEPGGAPSNLARV